MKKAKEKAKPTAAGRPVFPNGSYLKGRLASPKVRRQLSSQQPARFTKTAKGVIDNHAPAPEQETNA